MCALIQRADLVEKLRAQFGVVQGQIGGTLSDELVPVVIVDDVSGPDVVSSQHPLNAIGSSSSAAAVGFFSKVGLQNPEGSGVDIFVEYMLMKSTTDVTQTLRQSAIAVSPNAGVKTFLDNRAEGNPVGITWDENATVSLGIELIALRVANGMTRIDLGITLAELDSIHVQDAAANVAVDTVHYFWTERIRRE